MPLLTQDDFSKSIYIAGLETTATWNELCTYIEQYELEFLKAALGFEFYSLYYTSMSSTMPEQRFKDLTDGVEYQYNNKTIKFEGLMYALARYVYYWYIRNKATQTVPIGQAISKAQNATIIMPTLKLATALNEMNERLDQMWKFLRTEAVTYPEYESSQVDRCKFRGYVNHVF